MKKILSLMMVAGAALLVIGAGDGPTEPLAGKDSHGEKSTGRDSRASDNSDSGTSEQHGAADMFGGVVGGPHDFSQRGADACSACHIPHIQAIVPSTQPASQPAASMYRIPGQRQVFVPGRYSPGPTSLICLGCHDGTVATSTIGSSHALLAGVREGFDVPQDFVWRDHPIGVAYPDDHREYRPEAFAAKKLRLPEGKIECVSCHDPHNVAGVKGMLWMSNRRSALCLTCHNK